MAALETLRNIEDLRASLSDKLAELQRRANTVSQVLAPLKQWRVYWSDPVVRFGVGAVLGLVIGSRRNSTAASHEGVVHAVLRAGLMAAASSMVTRALEASPAATDDDADLQDAP